MADSKRRGRPYLDGETHSIPITLSLPPRELTRLSQEAQQQRCASVQELIRRKLSHDDSDDDE
jgi:hypothetical protein